MTCVEEGFRLTGPPSECSMRSKARIDALFEDSRSVCSSMNAGWYAALSTVTTANTEDVGTEEQMRVNSAVQARIEAMFASVEAETGVPGECAAAILSVKYMGAAPVGGRVASVKGLQEPLRQLLERIENSVIAELEVSRRGLTFRTESLEKNNPFRRIAVWSALRLRCKTNTNGERHHAFVPLVGDQDQGQTSEERHADLYRTMRGLRNEAEAYPPIFAVVMRRPGAARLLECHAFACESEEDAVAAAATLYRALLADLDANRRRPRHTNGVGCVSLASVASSVCYDQASIANNRNFSRSVAPSQPVPPHPVRPPRVKKSSISSSVTEDESANSRVEIQKPPTRRKKKNSDIKAEDILEARHRKERVDNQAQNREEYQNSKNKQYGRNKMREPPVASMVQQDRPSSRAEKIYDVHSNGIYEKPDNNYEKLAGQQRKDDLQLYSTVNSQRVNKNIYEKRNCTYEVNHDESRNGSMSRQLYVSRIADGKLYERNDKTRSRENSIYEINRVGQNCEDRFRDVDKIYSLGVEEIYESKSSRGAQENTFFSNLSSRNNSRRSSYCPQDRSTQNRKSSRDNEISGTKLCRVVTMDKPIRRMDDERLNESKMPVYSQPKVRKRSRAGSEPPVSRTDEAAKLYQDPKLKRSQSDAEVDRGDLLTRVELPRRGSFLNSGSTRRPNSIQGGTPLGFTELFDEFRNQEGLTSVDDILAAIIDPEGMSFNDLKPLYKEFLLKLAATLTQDELYQRSASIMRKRRRPQRRRSTRRPGLLSRAIKRSVSRLKGGPTEFTSVIFPARRLNDSFGSSSSYDARNNQNQNRVLASRLSRRRSSWKKNKKNGIYHTTSDDSDACEHRRRKNSLIRDPEYDLSGRHTNRQMVTATANRSSSGYVSCSECSYDSESCTCVSADKCYCSLSKRRVPAQPVSINAVNCACDTDSCSESNKCYCARKPVQPTILEQLRQRGIVPSESTLSRGGSPERAKNIKGNKSHSTSRSLEFLKVRPALPCGSSDNLALDYDLFNPGRRSQQSSDSEKILVVSARDTQGRLVYVGGGAERDKKYFPRTNRSNAHHEALSIKKSAEIAAVFGGDCSRMSRRASNASSLRSSISLEAGLGYLP